MGLSAWQITEETSLLAVVLSDFASNRTRPMMKSNTFPLPETHPKAPANDGRGLSCVEKKGGNSTPFNSTRPHTSCSRLEEPPQARFTVLKSSQCPAPWFVSCSLL